MRIGVFDSGIGGKSVANAIRQALPEHEVVFMHDTPEHFPYATKLPDEIYEFIVPIFDQFLEQACDVVVIACNTVSTTLAPRLRAAYTVPIIALEPMIKPASNMTRSGIIAICATPTTLASQRYAWLKDTYGQACTFIEPDCADWSSLIEHDQMNAARIRQEIDPALEAGADVIVLGCTHYHWIETEIKHIVAGHATVIQPETAIIRQVQRVLGLAA